MNERSNEQWLQDLSTPGPSQESALVDLRQVIIKGLPYALSGWLARDDPRFEALAEEAAQETLLRVLDHLQTFEGRSKFTTWVQKIAVRVSLTELRRKRWQNVSLEEMVESEEGMTQDKWLADTSANPERMVEGKDMMARLKRVMMEELTEKQRQAMTAIAIKGVPLEEVARRMGTNRNALYKLMHDTRLRLRQRLATEEVELTCDEVFAMLDEYTEKAMKGENVANLMPMVKQHLEMCPDCREEYEALERILHAAVE